MNEKLYYPVNASMDFYDNKDRYGDRIYDPDEIDQTQAAEYLPEVFMAVALDNKRFLNERGLMAYFWTENRDLEDSINFKVISAMPTVEKINGKLYGVTELELRVPLTPAELSELKDYITGQMSDGYGEGFEQHEIKTRDGELYISFWSSGGNYFVDTQQEFNQRLAMESAHRFSDGSMLPPSMQHWGYEMEKNIMLISKTDTTLELMMDGYHLTLNFLPENNYKLIEQIKDILTNSLSNAARDSR